ncbi:50S ribosomal protein L6 [Candidatus Microgenomates bacterium]|nr:MAG: 50S ribosomal protein L6 [Candidatus Microgenomates bacterium]
MSKIGKMPIEIKEGVKISIENNIVSVEGPKGKLSFMLPKEIGVKVEDSKIVVSQKQNPEDSKAMFGLVRATIANMVKGVSQGFEKKLELSGVGYRAQVTGNDLSLSVGYSHPVKIPAPAGIKFLVADSGIIISGIDKKIVGDVAATIRAVRPPDPYKAKGISYAGERIRRKAGKAAKAVGGK